MYICMYMYTIIMYICVSVCMYVYGTEVCMYVCMYEKNAYKYVCMFYFINMYVRSTVT